MDPNATPTPEAAPDPAPEVDTRAELMDAMDRGVEEASVAPEPAPEVDIPDPKEPAPAPEPVTPEPKAEPEAPVDPEAAKPEPEADIEGEIKGFGLKEKAAARFRELTSAAKEGTALRDTLAEHGIKDIAADLPRFIQKAQAADDLIGMVTDSGASPEQYGQTLDYLSLVNKGVAGDRAATEQAFEIAQREVTNLATLLGKEVPGLYDPLAAHDDLVEAVEDGKITRKHALEIAGGRQQQTVADTRKQQVQQGDASQQAQDGGKEALQQFDQSMAASDPSYAGKRAQLSSLVGFIRKTLPPEQWLAATQQAYQAIPSAPAPAPTPRPNPLPRPGPIRGGNQRPAMLPTTDDPMEAMNQGIASAT